MRMGSRWMPNWEPGYRALASFVAGHMILAAMVCLTTGLVLGLVGAPGSWPLRPAPSSSCTHIPRWTSPERVRAEASTPTTVIVDLACPGLTFAL